MEKDIEIGIKIVANIYLTVVGNDLPTAFEVAKINGVSEENFGTVVTYIGYDSDPSSLRYIVEESKEEIDKAIERVKFYRDAAIEKINSLLE